MEIKLNKDKCNEYLESYMEIGYKKSKIFSLNEGAMIGKYIRLLNGKEIDPKITLNNIYTFIFSALEIMNKNSSFTLGDASLLNNVMNYIKKEILSKQATNKDRGNIDENTDKKKCSEEIKGKFKEI
jgi:hypothetical protein